MASEQKLNDLRFSVCALGDTSYEKFCQTGKDIDAKLEALGAQRLTLAPIAMWITKMLLSLGSTLL